MADARLLLQDGAFLLLQDGSKLLLQDDVAVATPGANIYREQDAVRIITLVSDDNGVTWRPRGVAP